MPSARRAGGLQFAPATQAPRVPAVRGRSLARTVVKLISRLADNSFVQKSALITGLTLALSAATLAGIGEWAAGAFDGAAPGPGSSAATSADADYTGRLAPLPAVVLSPPAKAAPPDAPGYTIRRTVPEVRLRFTVADELGHPVQSLSAADVRVIDDQSPVERFSDFERDENVPLRLGILMDTSDSVKRVLADEKTAAIAFLGRILKPRGDRTFVMTFGANYSVWRSPSSDMAELAAAVTRMKQPGGGTRLYDALQSACLEQFSADEDSVPVHRALVVLTDGEDTQSFHELRDVVAAALRNEIQIYALTLHSPRVTTHGDLVLQQLADATGGRYFVARSSRELDAAFTQIEQELRTQYYVSFAPRSGPGYHSLQVEVRAPQRLLVRARQGYFAFPQ